MTIPEAAKKLNLSEQLLRVWIQNTPNHPFGTVVRDGTRKTYYINAERLKAWIEGSTNNDD